jgi:hypothetical protein
LAAGERDGESFDRSIPSAGVLWKISWGEVGPQETPGSTEITAHAATATDVRKLENMLAGKEDCAKVGGGTNFAECRIISLKSVY